MLWSIGLEKVLVVQVPPCWIDALTSSQLSCDIQTEAYGAPHCLQPLTGYATSSEFFSLSSICFLPKSQYNLGSRGKVGALLPLEEVEFGLSLV